MFSTPAGPRGIPPARRFLFVALMIAAPLVALEIVCAVYLNYLSADPRSLAARNVPWHVYDAYRTHALGPGWRSGGKAHNNQGFRRTGDVSARKPPNTFRVFLMGGSAAYGLDAAPSFPRVTITNDQTIDHKLEMMLRHEFGGRTIEVINAAVTGYWTHHHLVYLHETLLDYDPDLIIVLDGINDYYHTLPEHRQFESYRYGLPLRLDNLNEPTFMTSVRDLLEWGKRYSHAAYVAHEAAARLFGWNIVPDDPCNLEEVQLEDLNDDYRRRYESIAARTWVRTLSSVLLTLQDSGVRAITTLQPELVFRQTHGMSEADRRLLTIEVGQRPRFYPQKKAFLKPIARHLAEQTAARHGATFVDLTDIFDDRGQYFIDYCHLSEAGADRIASVLFPYVRSEVLRKESSRPSVEHAVDATLESRSMVTRVGR